MNQPIVALYWDFEDIHSGLFEELHGPGTYRDKDRRFAPHDALIHIGAVVEYAESLGNVAFNRAYANWQWFARYRDDLNDHNLELIQLYPRGVKNGGNVRIALDILQDVYQRPQITHVVLVSGDGEFVSLAQKLQQLGKTVIGVGIEQSANGNWIRACNEFKLYRNLVQRAEGGEGREIEAEEFTQTREMTLSTLRKLLAHRGASQVPAGDLRQQLLRTDPSFDEGNVGFVSFPAYLRSLADAVEVSASGEVGLKGDAASSPARSYSTPRQNSYSSYSRERSAHAQYEQVLYRGTFRPLPYPWWRAGVLCFEETLRAHADRYMPTFEFWEEQVSAALAAKGLDSDPQLVHRLRGSLWALRQFILLPDRNGVSLSDAVWEKELTLQESMDEEIVRRLLRYGLAPLDVDTVGRILFHSEAEQHRDEVIETISIVAEELGMTDSMAYTGASPSAPAATVEPEA